MTASNAKDREQSAWKEHNLSQLRYFRSLSLRDKILALEGLQKTFEKLQAERIKRAKAKKDSAESGL